MRAHRLLLLVVLLPRFLGVVRNLGPSSLARPIEDGGTVTVKDYGCGYFFVIGGGSMVAPQLTFQNFTPDAAVHSISPLSNDPRVHTPSIATLGDLTDADNDGWTDVVYCVQSYSLLDVGKYDYILSGTYRDENGHLWSLLSRHFLITIASDPPTASPFFNPHTPAINGGANTLVPESSDYDGYVIGNYWQLITAPPNHVAVLQSPNGAPTTITFVDERDIGLWKFRLDVDDNVGERKTFYLSYTVQNLPPDLTITGGPKFDDFSPIALATSTTTDLDGGPPLTFIWDIMASPLGASVAAQENYSTGSSISIPTNEVDVGSWQFRLKATDNEGESNYHFATVTVSSPCAIPTGSHPPRPPLWTGGTATILPWTVDHSKSIADLTASSADASDADVGGLTLGLGATVHNPQFGVRYTPTKTGNYFCYWTIPGKLSVDMAVSVFVASEYHPGRCPYNAILAHEKKHVDAYQAVMNTWLPQWNSAVMGALPNPQAQLLVRDVNAETQSLEQQARDALSALKPAFDAAAADAQKALDTPAAYFAVVASCTRYQWQNP